MDTLAVDGYVVDTLMPDLVGHDRQPSAFLVYLFLYRRTGGDPSVSASLSLRELAEGTGLSKRTVQSALRRLRRRRLVEARRASITAVPEYSIRRPWARKGS